MRLLIIAALLAAIGGLSALYKFAENESLACKKSGGLLVRTDHGYECVNVQVIEGVKQ